VVSSLIPIGTEPHDFEPTVQQIQGAEAADIIVFNGAGFDGPRMKKMNAKFVVDTSYGLNLTIGTNEHVEENSSEHNKEASFDPTYGWILY
jgi:zinc transport system substrate-binding protein